MGADGELIEIGDAAPAAGGPWLWDVGKSVDVEEGGGDGDGFVIEDERGGDGSLSGKRGESKGLLVGFSVPKLAPVGGC